MRGLLRGEMGQIDAIICDGAFDDPNAFEQINWVVPVLARLHQLAGCGGANWLKRLERDIKSRHYSL